MDQIQFYDMRVSRTSKAVMGVFKDSVEPLRVSDVANKLNITFQTANKHINYLVEKGDLKGVGKDGNARMFAVGRKQESLPSVNWGGKEITIREKTQQIITDGKKIQNPYTRVIVQTFAELYGMAYKAIGQDERITIQEVKRTQSRLYQTKENLLTLQNIIQSLINQSELWDPKSIPKEMILKDPTISVEDAGNFAQSLADLLQFNTRED